MSHGFALVTLEKFLFSPQGPLHLEAEQRAGEAVRRPIPDRRGGSPAGGVVAGGAAATHMSPGRT